MQRKTPLGRRTPLERGKPLARTPWPRTPTPSGAKGAASLSRGRDTGPDARTRRRVYERDDWKCVCCGIPVEDRPHSVGHRIRRSQGLDNSLPNLLTFLGLGVNPFDPDDHHARIDSRRDPHDEARGLSLRSWQDPAAEPVAIASEHGSGATVWLTADGGYSAAPPAGVMAS